jgi:hypothetical protein
VAGLGAVQHQQTAMASMTTTQQQQQQAANTQHAAPVTQHSSEPTATSQHPVGSSQILPRVVVATKFIYNQPLVPSALEEQEDNKRAGTFQSGFQAAHPHSPQCPCTTASCQDVSYELTSQGVEHTACMIGTRGWVRKP